MDFDAMNKPELLKLAEQWHLKDTKHLTAKQLREALTERARYDCPKCIWFEADVNLQSLGFPVISSRNGDACRQLKTILPVLVTRCPEFQPNQGQDGKSRDARHRQSKRKTNGEQKTLDDY